MTPFEGLKIQVAGMANAEQSVVQLVAGIAAYAAQMCGEKGAEVASHLRTDAHAMASAVVTRTTLDPAIAREEESVKDAAAAAKPKETITAQPAKATQREASPAP